MRSDIRPSFAGLSGIADGIPLTIALTLVSSSTCEPLAGRAVYLWHCDRLGRYSLYSSGATDKIALPKATCDEVFATSGYEASVTTLSRVSLATDNVFSDGSSLELATMTGAVSGGLTATLTVAV